MRESFKIIGLSLLVTVWLVAGVGSIDAANRIFKTPLPVDPESHIELTGEAVLTSTGTDAQLGEYWYLTVDTGAALVDAYCLVEDPCAILDGDVIQAVGYFDTLGNVPIVVLDEVRRVF